MLVRQLPMAKTEVSTDYSTYPVPPIFISISYVNNDTVLHCTPWSEALAEQNFDFAVFWA